MRPHRKQNGRGAESSQCGTEIHSIEKGLRSERGPKYLQLASRQTEGIFFDIVEARTRDHQPLLVTTNHSGAAMEKLFSENIAAPLVRRLRDHCDCFAFEQGT